MAEIPMAQGQIVTAPESYNSLTGLITDALAMAFKLRELEAADHLLDALRVLQAYLPN